MSFVKLLAVFVSVLLCLGFTCLSVQRAHFLFVGLWEKTPMEEAGQTVLILKQCNECGDTVPLKVPSNLSSSIEEQSVICPECREGLCVRCGNFKGVVLMDCCCVQLCRDCAETATNWEHNCDKQLQ